MKAPFFSIVIPTCNSSSTLRLCIDSIFKQTFSCFEVWIIDNNSTDKTLQIVKEYSLKFSNLHWISEKDKGIYDAMNKGMQLAIGEWVYFLGSDDKLASSNVLEKVFLFNKNNHNVIYGNVRVIGNTTWAGNNALYDGQFDLSKFLKKNICHQAIFYKLKFLKDCIGTFNIDYEVCSDWDFNLRCWSYQPMRYMPLTVADFYAGGLTTKTNDDNKFSTDFKINVIHYFGIQKLAQQLPDVEFTNICHFIKKCV